MTLGTLSLSVNEADNAPTPRVSVIGKRRAVGLYSLMTYCPQSSMLIDFPLNVACL